MTQILSHYLDMHFPIGCYGRDVAAAYRLVEDSEMIGYACPICGNIHISSYEGDLQIARRRCIEDEVVAWVYPERRGWTQIADQAKNYRSDYERISSMPSALVIRSKFASSAARANPSC